MSPQPDNGRAPVDIVIDDLERIKEGTDSSFDSGCLAGAVDLIHELAAERDALRAIADNLYNLYGWLEDKEPGGFTMPRSKQAAIDAYEYWTDVHPQPESHPSPVEGGTT